MVAHGLPQPREIRSAAEGEAAVKGKRPHTYVQIIRTNFLQETRDEV